MDQEYIPSWSAFVLLTHDTNPEDLKEMGTEFMLVACSMDIPSGVRHKWHLPGRKADMGDTDPVDTAIGAVYQQTGYTLYTEDLIELAVLERDGEDVFIYNAEVSNLYDLNVQPVQDETEIEVKTLHDAFYGFFNINPEHQRLLASAAVIPHLFQVYLERPEDYAVDAT